MTEIPSGIKVTQETLSKGVASRLTTLILERYFEPGDKLPPQRQLAGELGVSRTVLREAVTMLVERGLLETKQGSGTFVRNPSYDSLSDSLDLLLRTSPDCYYQLLELREVIDGEFAARLARGASEESLQKLDRHLAELRQVLGSPDQFVERDVAFHMAFYSATGNDVLLSIMQPITQLLMETMSITFASPGSAQRSLKQHEKLVECIRNGDVEGARRNVRETALRARERLMEGLGSAAENVDSAVASPHEIE